MFEVPESVRPIRDQVRQFIEERIYPVEHILNERNDPEGHEILLGLQREAKKQGLWALGHPFNIGGKGLPFMDYVYVNEVIGRSEHANIALGTTRFRTRSCSTFTPHPNGAASTWRPLSLARSFRASA